LRQDVIALAMSGWVWLLFCLRLKRHPHAKDWSRLLLKGQLQLHTVEANIASTFGIEY